MFTGLVEEVGTIQEVRRDERGGRYTVRASVVLDGARPGDSIAVDGACMTLVALGPGEDFQAAPGKREPADRDFTEPTVSLPQGGDGKLAWFSFEASPESLSKTNFCGFETGRRVNLERPLTPASRIGGHYVTGHVDGLATVESVVPQGNSIIYTFRVDDPALAELLVPKGSVAVLGISLTVNAVDENRFSVAIIPHTLAHTNLDDYHPGDRVNIETDLLGKYVRRLLFSREGHDALAGDAAASMKDTLQGNASVSGIGRLPEAGMPGLLENGAVIDDAALVPAMNTFVPIPAAAQAAKTQPSKATIRSGGWFNFEQ